MLHQGCWSERAQLRRGGERLHAPRASPTRSTCCSGASAWRGVEWDTQRRAQPAQCAGRHRRGRARGRGARGSGARAGRVPQRQAPHGTARHGAAAITVYDDFAHHPTAIRTTVDGLRRKLGPARRPHPGGVRAAQQHHEAGRHEGAAALEPGAGRPGVLPQRRAGLGRRARRWRRWASARRGRPAPSTSWSRRSAAAAEPGDHIVCMSNGGFGGIHAKLLEALRAPLITRARAAPAP